MHWHLSNRADKRALPIADRHYNRQKIGSPQFVQPGRCLVLLNANADALWVTSFPFKEYVKHPWGGAFVCSCFRNESQTLSSLLILDAVAATVWKWPTIPELGMITFVDPKKVRHKRDFGRCYRKAGFIDAQCPIHAEQLDDCCYCHSRTKAGLWALQMFPDKMPQAQTPIIEEEF